MCSTCWVITAGHENCVWRRHGYTYGHWLMKAIQVWQPIKIQKIHYKESEKVPELILLGIVGLFPANREENSHENWYHLISLSPRDRDFSWLIPPYLWDLNKTEPCSVKRGLDACAKSINPGWHELNLFAFFMYFPYNSNFYNILWYCPHVVCIEWKCAIFFPIAYFDITYFGAFFMCIAMYWTILNPAISAKIKIWTAAIIINLIVKHHVLGTFRCKVCHENMKNNHVWIPNDNH